VGRQTRNRRPRPRREFSRGRRILLIVFIAVIGVTYALTRMPSEIGLDEDGLVVLHNWLNGEPADSLADVSFRRCGRPPHDNCVIDGDTFYFEHQSIRIADIDTPEINPARCEREAQLGEQATQRLLQLLNNGPFEIETTGNRDEDQYGRKLRILTRAGRSLGEVLEDEGLARAWTGRQLPWCD
jgi:micrococcal nuclease